MLSMSAQITLLAHSQFQLFGLAHLLVILATIVTTLCSSYYLRTAASPRFERIVRISFGCLLITAVMLDPVLTLLRYGSTPLGWSLVTSSSLPFYLCDVVSIILAIALFTKNQRLAEIGYLWGLAGTVQGLITPTLWFGWDTPEFHIFFLQHGGVPIAAVMLVWGLGIIPLKGAFKRSVYWSWSYIILVMIINWALGQNYGFLNGVPEVPTLFDYMGPYPYYLITLQVIAFSLYFFLLKVAPKDGQQMQLDD
jgi:hypothetical integral membrane protein (TIGR02206 family)